MSDIVEEAINQLHLHHPPQEHASGSGDNNNVENKPQTVHQEDTNKLENGEVEKEEEDDDEQEEHPSHEVSHQKKKRNRRRKKSAADNGKMKTTTTTATATATLNNGLQQQQQQQGQQQKGEVQAQHAEEEQEGGPNRKGSNNNNKNNQTNNNRKDPLIVECPHCGGSIVVLAIKCAIFRHGTLKKNGRQIPPHTSKELCEEYVAKDLIWGCGKPFRIVDKTTAVACDYI